MSNGTRGAFAAAICFAFAAPAFPGSFSFTGNFDNDNDVQLFTFNLAASATVTLQTLGFGGSAALPGGLNAAGQAIAGGGFESVLQIYSAPSGVAVGGPIQPGPNPTCPPRTPDPARLNFCQDAYAQVLLPAGSYFVALTQSANDPLGNLSDGFFYVDTVPDPNFNNGFVGTFGFQGTSAWALDISNVTTAAAVTTTVPEPSAVLLTATTLFLVGLRSRRKKVVRPTSAPRRPVQTLAPPRQST